MVAAAVRLLMVEDSAHHRLLVIDELTTVSEPLFQIAEALTLGQAHARLREEETDVVLLDLSLPDSEGLNGLKSIAREFPSVPIVIYTAHRDEKMALRAFRDGAQDYLIKGDVRGPHLRRVLLHAMERKRVDISLNHQRESMRAAQRLEMLGRIAGKVAHDFNNILNTVSGFADLVLEDLEDHPCHADVLEIKQAAQRGAKLTRSILDFSVRGSNTQEACCLDELVTGLTGVLRLLLPSKCRLMTELSAAQRSVAADPAELEQVLTNLILNAKDALGTRGLITVLTGFITVDGNDASLNLVPGDYLTLEVEDNGIGMEEVCSARMFDPFFTTKAHSGGTGLGLSAVMDFIRAQKGNISVDSQPNRGTRITLYLPEMKPECPGESSGVSHQTGGSAIVLGKHLFSEPEYARVFETLGIKILSLSPKEATTFVCDSTVHFLFMEGREADGELLEWADDLLPQWSNLQVVMVGSHSEGYSWGSLASSKFATLWRPFSPNALDTLLRRPRV